MFKSKGLMGAVAASMAAVATLAVFLYVKGVREEAKTGGTQVEVIVAKEDIPTGTDLDTLIAEGGFETQTIPETAMVEGAVTSLGDLEDAKTSSPVVAGEQMTTARLQGEGQLAGGALGIPTGFKAQSFSLEAQRVVGNEIQPGDEVTVFATGPYGKTSGTDKESTVTITIIPQADVLKFVGPGDASFETTGSGEPIITLAVSNKDAPKITFAKETGALWVDLISPGDKAPRTPPVGFNQMGR